MCVPCTYDSRVLSNNIDDASDDAAAADDDDDDDAGLDRSVVFSCAEWCIN